MCRFCISVACRYEKLQVLGILLLTDPITLNPNREPQIQAFRRIYPVAYLAPSAGAGGAAVRDAAEQLLRRRTGSKVRGDYVLIMAMVTPPPPHEKFVEWLHDDIKTLLS